MASKKKVAVNDNSMKVILVVALALAFIGGYLVSRARYKPQILELNKMIMEKDGTINTMRANANRVMRRDDEMWIVKDGMVSRMEEEVVMSNGDKAMPDGMIVKSDGSEVRLQNGQSMGMDGQMMMEEETNSGF